MIVREILRTCSNPHVARAAVASIGGDLAQRVSRDAAERNLTSGIFYASNPITPASDILHELSKLKNFGVKTLQSEDEIAAAGAAVFEPGVAGDAGVGTRSRLR